MSIKALKWATEIMDINCATKCVLLVLANYADKNDKCWPGTDNLAKICCLNKRSVIRSLNKLIELKLIFKEKRYSEKGGRSSNLYILNTKTTEGLSDTVSPKGGDRESLKGLSDTVSRLSDTLSPKGGGLSDTVSPYTKDNKQDTKEDTKEKESVKEKESQVYKDYAVSVLDYLNEMRSGKNPFLPGEENMNLIVSRMKELVDLLEIEIKEAATFCTRIICHQQKEWGTDAEQRKYLRPKTLFHKTNFHQYFGDLPMED